MLPDMMTETSAQTVTQCTKKNGGVCFKNFCKGRDSTLVNHLGEDLGQDLGQDLGEDLGKDLGQDLG